jgi:hypothetical protein
MPYLTVGDYRKGCSIWVFLARLGIAFASIPRALNQLVVRINCRVEIIQIRNFGEILARRKLFRSKGTSSMLIL